MFFFLIIDVNNINDINIFDNEMVRGILNYDLYKSI